VQQSESLLEQLFATDHSHLQVVLLAEGLSDLREVLGSALHIPSAVSPLASLVAGAGEIDEPVGVGDRGEEGNGGSGVRF